MVKKHEFSQFIWIWSLHSFSSISIESSTTPKVFWLFVQFLNSTNKTKRDETKWKRKKKIVVFEERKRKIPTQIPLKTRIARKINKNGSHARKKRKIFIVKNCECQRFKTNTNYEPFVYDFRNAQIEFYRLFEIVPFYARTTPHLCTLAFHATLLRLHEIGRFWSISCSVVCFLYFSYCINLYLLFCVCVIFPFEVIWSLHWGSVVCF